jgi:hypothetical protein
MVNKMKRSQKIVVGTLIVLSSLTAGVLTTQSGAGQLSSFDPRSWFRDGAISKPLVPDRIIVSVPSTVAEQGFGWVDSARVVPMKGFRPPSPTDPAPVYADKSTSEIIGWMYPDLDVVRPGVTFEEARAASTQPVPTSIAPK